MSFRIIRVLVTLVCFAYLAVGASAQYRASLQGTVLDGSGAAIPGATVKATSQETGRTIESKSSSTGFYRIPGLAPGNYTITATAAGFNSATVKDVQVAAEQPQAADITLKPQAVEQTVDVAGESVPAVQTENANIGGAIGTEQVQRLPETGRDPYNLVRLAPGVFGDASRTGSGGASNLPSQVGPGGSNSEIFQTENQVQVVANGQRVTANNLQLDGVSVNSLGQGGAAVITPNVESVKEVVVVSNSYSAEDGRNSGAQIKVISQNGTNVYHGSGLIKFNDKGLNAFNKYTGRTNVAPHSITCESGTPSQFTINADACPERTDQKYRQFAGSLGGPILHDKLFFFASYEGVRNNSSHIDRQVGIETQQFRDYVKAHNPNSIAAKVFSMDGIAPRIESITESHDCCSFDGRPLGAWYQPGIAVGQAIGAGPDLTPDWAFADIRVPSIQKGNQYNTRLDYNQGLNQIFGSFYYVDFDDQGGGHRAIEDVEKTPRNVAVTANWNRTFSSTVLNEFRVNFTRFTFDQVNDNFTNWGLPNITLFDFDIGGLGSNYALGAGRSSTTPGRLAQNTFEFRDTLSTVHGSHALKFGAEFRREQDNNDQSGGARPNYQFRGLLNFANDACCFFEGVDVNPLTGGKPDGQRYFRTGAYSFFGQDDWRVRKNLILNLGLRYEFYPSISEKNNRLSNYIFGSGVNTLPSNFILPGLVNGSVKPASELFTSNKTNFAPRLGFAWSPDMFNGKGVFRGGFGIHFNRPFDTIFTNVRQNTPFFASAGLCCFFDPGPIVGAPPGSHIQYGLGSSRSPYSYTPNPQLAFGVAPDGALCGDATCATVTPVDIFATLPKEPTPYVYVYSLEFENEFAKNWVLSLGYQGSNSRKLIRTVDLNRLNAGDTFGNNNRDRFQQFSADGVACGPTNPACVAAHPTGNPRFNRIFVPLPDVNANFNALIARVTHRFSHGLQFEGVYRWSKSMDSSSFEIGNQQAEPANQKLNYGPSDYDVTHSFTFSALYDLPIFRNRNDFLGKAVGGWQINTILSAHTGFPWSPVVFGDENTDLNGDGFRPDFPTRFLGGTTTGDFINGIFPGAGNTFFDVTTRGPGGVKRNSFRGPGYFDTDLSLVKQIGLPKMPFFGEHSNLELRANAFNAFNRLNLAPIAQYSCNADVGNSFCFGRSGSALSGRVVEFQARFSF